MHSMLLFCVELFAWGSAWIDINRIVYIKLISKKKKHYKDYSFADVAANS